MQSFSLSIFWGRECGGFKAVTEKRETKLTAVRYISFKIPKVTFTVTRRERGVCRGQPTGPGVCCRVLRARLGLWKY